MTARGRLADLLPPAAVAALTTWVCLFSWRGFTSTSARFLVPLLILAVLVAGLGVGLRLARLPATLVFVGQALVSGVVAFALLTGSLLPTAAARLELRGQLEDAIISAQTYAAPIPPSVPGVEPVLILGGLACLLLVDLLACTLRRAPLAGLPLLTIYTVPVSVTGEGASWWVLVLTAAGFAAMLFLEHGDRLGRWGRGLEGADDADQAAFGVRTGAVRGTAVGIAASATALAVVLPVFIPTVTLSLFDFGAGSGAGDIHISNPTTDLRRNLDRGQDVPLLRVETDDPDPSYLRIAVLARLSDEEWSSGDREIPVEQVAQGAMPPLEGVADDVARRQFQYQVSATDDFDSIWLPTADSLASINANGDWRYDVDTMDFLAGDDDTNARSLSWSFTRIALDRRALSMAEAGIGSTAVNAEFTFTPGDMAPAVRDLAREVTDGQPTRFQRAVALQQWFREDGGFTYSLEAGPGNGSGDNLLSFLSEDGRVGYCEQFASAMAVMARTLGIPSRVAVGFLDAEQVGPRTWEFSAHDMHAWPELFFPGSGWVRFEPTPSARATEVPSYTQVELPEIQQPTTVPSVRPSEDLPSRAADEEDVATDDADDGTATAVPWREIVLVGAGILLLGGLVLLPRTLRRIRRERRWRHPGGPIAAWAELRDSALDLGVPWPEQRSPRSTAGHLVEFFGAPRVPDGPERPATGSGLAPEAVSALRRIVLAVERARYAREPDAVDAAVLRADVETCVDALADGVTRARRRRALWWPRSLFGARSRGVDLPPEGPSATSPGILVDHVG